MKTLRNVITVAVLSAAFAFAQNVLAESAVIGEHTWSCSVSGGNATITGVSPATGDIAIPAKINGYDVTSIGEYTFWECRDLTRVTIPDSVTSIGYAAFASCSGLASVTIPGRVTRLDDYAFWDCGSMTNITFKGNAPTVGESAFHGISKDCLVQLPPGNKTYFICIAGIANADGTMIEVSRQWSGLNIKQN